ncbi:MAG: hypothetical protein IJT14_02830 [Rickettsiales bacterium]|nr:hypothetical protein [Rickettsiales bacterium]
MNKKDCVKYSEFANAHSYTILGGTVKGINFNSPYVLCNTAANQSVFPPSRKLLAPTFVQSRYMSTCWLSLAGLIEEKMYCRNWNGIGGHNWYSEGQVYSKGAKTDFRYYPQATFNSEMVVGYHGFDDYKIDATTTYDYKYNFLTYNFNKDSTYEVVDPNFKSAVHKHNTIFIVNSNLGCTCTSPYVNCACKNSRGALSAKMTSELDAKIDDGRPGTGRLLGYKNDYVHQNTAPSDDEINKVCYDKPINEVSSALYEKSSDLRFGCNIIKVMEDVK